MNPTMNLYEVIFKDQKSVYAVAPDPTTAFDMVDREMENIGYTLRKRILDRIILVASENPSYSDTMLHIFKEPK